MNVDPVRTTSGLRAHPLFHMGKALTTDLFSTLIFVLLFALTHSIYLAVSFAILLGVTQIIYLRIRGAPVDLMQWCSLGLVIVFGSATLITRNPAFIMVKPTLIYTAIGLVMLRRGWMTRYLPPIGREHSVDITTIFGYVWAALMLGTALANLGFVFAASPATWAWFIGMFPLASKLVLVAIQYGVTRAVVRRRIRAGHVMMPTAV